MKPKPKTPGQKMVEAIKHLRRSDGVGPCRVARAWLRKQRSPQQAWDECSDYDWMLWLLCACSSPRFEQACDAESREWLERFRSANINPVPYGPIAAAAIRRVCPKPPRIPKPKKGSKK